MEKRLHRSRSDRMIWGVCGGLAKYFDIDPTIVRIITILLIFVGGIGILGYLIFALVLPVESSTATEPKDVIRENVQEIKNTATQMGQEIRTTFSEEHKSEARSEEEQKASDANFRRRGLVVLGLVIAVVGLAFLLSNFFSWFHWKYIWPLVLIIAGILIIFGARRSK